MLRIVFLGVGEACDEAFPNTSIWLQGKAAGRRGSILLDCGFTVPPHLWRQCPDHEDLDAVWISHCHGDHYFGLPALLLRFWEKKRHKPLLILGPAGMQASALEITRLAYPGFLENLSFPLLFREVNPEDEFECTGFRWRFAASGHGQTNLAVRLDDGRQAIFYSGDGSYTSGTLELAGRCNLVIHEAFRLEGATLGHGTFAQCVEFARAAAVRSLALVHVQRDERRERLPEILRYIKKIEDVHVFLPEPGEILDI